MTSTTIINQWPDGLTWGCSDAAYWLIAVKGGRSNYWDDEDFGAWLYWQGDPMEGTLSGLTPDQFVLPLEYLT